MKESAWSGTPNSKQDLRAAVADDKIENFYREYTSKRDSEMSLKDMSDSARRRQTVIPKLEESTDSRS